MMIKFTDGPGVLLALALGSMTAAGCESVALVGRPSIADQAQEVNEVSGEVDRIDNRSREIRVRANDGRSRTVQYSSDTRVIYRGREHAVGDLEPGDRIVAQVKEDARGAAYVDLIRVQESVRDRRGAGVRSDRIETLTGTVERVDERGASFDVRDPSGERVVVSLAPNARSTDLDFFQRLRNGDYVRVEGRFLGRDRFEAEAFL